MSTGSKFLEGFHDRAPVESEIVAHDEITCVSDTSARELSPICSQTQENKTN